SGSKGGDRLEALLLRSLWNGDALPPVATPKAVTGEYGGGHLGAAVLAAAGSPLGPAPGFGEPDPELGIVPHDGPRRRPRHQPGGGRGGGVGGAGASRLESRYPEASSGRSRTSRRGNG